MAQLVSHKDTTLLTVNRQIILLDLNNATCLQVIDLPAVKAPPKSAGDGATAEDTGDAVAAVAAADDVIDVDEINNSNTRSPTVAPVASNRILHAAISPDSQLLAVATADEKCLHLYQLSATTASSDVPFARLLSSRPLSRTANAIRFSVDSRQLFVADKTGDCFEYVCAGDAADQQAAGKCVLSHLSMVLGIGQTSCGRFLLSCDRDEKIRCTNYPRTTLIESYCLGHTEYVAAVELLPGRPESTLVVSASGDKTLRVWNYLDGKEVARFDLPAPALRMAVRAVSADVAHVAVTLYEHSLDVIVYEVRRAVETDKFTASSIAEFALEGVVHVQSVTFDVHGDVLLSGITQSDETAVFRLNGGDSSYVLDSLDALNGEIAAQAADLMVAFNAEEISLLFKKKFHNIHDYQERKKRRIEEKHSKQSNGGGGSGGGGTDDGDIVVLD